MPHDMNYGGRGHNKRQMNNSTPKGGGGKNKGSGRNELMRSVKEARRAPLPPEAAWIGKIMHLSAIVDREDCRLPSGASLCCRACIKTECEANDEYKKAIISKHENLQPQLLSGCPLAEGMCVDMYGKAREHHCPRGDYPRCSHGSSCKEVFCFLNHTALTTVNNIMPTNSATDAIPANELATILQEKHDALLREAQLKAELAAVKHNMQTELKDAHDRLCTLQYAICGPTGLIAALDAPYTKHNDQDAEWTCDMGYLQFLFTVNRVYQTPAATNLYVSLHYPDQSDGRHIFDDYADQYGYTRPSTMMRVDDAPASRPISTGHATANTTVAMVADVQPNDTDDGNVVILPLQCSPPQHCSTVSHIVPPQHPAHTFAIATSVTSQHMDPLVLQLLQLFAPPPPMEKAYKLNLIHDTDVFAGRFERAYNMPSLRSVGLQPEAFTTHAYFIECYCTMLVTGSFLHDTFGQIPNACKKWNVMAASRARPSDIGMDIPPVDGTVLSRSQGPRPTIPHCPTTNRAWLLSTPDRIMICQKVVALFRSSGGHITSGQELEQFGEWLKTRTELHTILLKYRTPIIDQSPLCMSRRGRSAKSYLACNRSHPAFTNYYGIMSRTNNFRSAYASSILCDPAFTGIYSPVTFGQSNIDPCSVIALDYMMTLFAGVKPGAPDEILMRMYCIDRIDTNMHYITGNCRWLSLGNNAANDVTVSQRTQHTRDKRRARATRFIIARRAAYRARRK